MKELLQQKLNDIDQQILLKRSYIEVSSLLDDKNVVLYLLSFFI
jgi:hypothetical protein